MEGNGADTKEYAYICIGEVGGRIHMLSLHVSPQVEQFCYMVVWLYAQPIQVLYLDSAIYFFVSLPLVIFHKINISLFAGRIKWVRKKVFFLRETYSP